MKYVRIYLLLFGASILIAFLIGMWMPDYGLYLVKGEDSLVENLTAFFCLTTFLLGFLLSVKSEKNRKVLIMVAAVGLVCFLDEISFGEELFNLNMPHIGCLKIDAVHDFFCLGFIAIILLERSYPVLLFSSAAIGAILTIVATRKFRTKIIGMVSALNCNKTGILLLLFVFLGFAAMILDLDILYLPPFLEELLEMDAAMALLFYCLSLHTAARITR